MKVRKPNVPAPTHLGKGLTLEEMYHAPWGGHFSIPQAAFEAGTTVRPGGKRKRKGAKAMRRSRVSSSLEELRRAAFRRRWENLTPTYD